MPEEQTLRLGVYVDAPFRIAETQDGRRIATHPSDYAFLGVFLPEVARHFRSTVVLGRVEQTDGVGDFVTLPKGVDLAPLPYYPSLAELGAVARAARRTVAAFRRSLGRADVFWIAAPHPFALVLAALAAARRKPFVLGIRQDSTQYFRERLRSPGSRPLLLPLVLLDVVFRVLGRRSAAIVAGSELARRYGGCAERVLVLMDSAISERDVARVPHERDWSEDVNLLTVGRIDAEKNPLLLVDALARLGSRYRLTWVGDGPMRAEVARQAEVLGVRDRLDLRGWVPFGPALLDLYREAHVFVHVALTEGTPRVLFEALACAAPVVATDVGGVRAALDDGRAGLLVPARNVRAVVDAVERMTSDAELRDRFVGRGIELASEHTREVQAARAAAFIKGIARSS